MSRDYSFARLAAAVLLAGALSTTCRDSQAPRDQATPRADVTPLPSVVLVGAGNIAWCSRTNDEATAALLDAIPGTVFAIGDNVYPNGTTANYTNCYGPSWGRHKSRTSPALGNHEYDSSATAAPYFNYYGAAAGDAGKGYYSYDLGAWHIIVLNSNNTYVSTAAGSTQETWLKADLAATTKQCVLAMWHSPRFYSTTSSAFYPTSSVKTFWEDLYAAHATLIINAHMHDYERFAPQTAAGAADPVNGIREIIVGTGGGGLDLPNTLIIPNSEVLISQVYGVLKLTLADGAYGWQFIPVAGQAASDSGTATCHGTSPTVNHAPTAVAGGPYSGSEGTAVSFDGSASSDPDGDALTYVWSFGDGSTAAGAKPSHTYANNGTYTVTLTVTDARGAASSPVTVTATIANVAPAVNAGANQTVTVGTRFTLNASFTDPGLNDAPWTYTIAWGDGSPQTTGSATSQASPITAAHSYTAAGTDTVRVTVTDKDGAMGSGQVTVTVTATPNQAPTAAAGGPYLGAEGTALVFDGSGSSDPDGDALTYAWSFGDGSTGTGVKPSHTYANNGTYTVTLTVTDARGAASSPVTVTATVANVAPSVNAAASQTATAGSPFTLNATFSDPGVNDAPWSYSINWGDGSPQTTGSTNSQLSSITAVHTYAAAGSNTVRVTVTDKDGGAGVGTLTVTVTTVANRPPTAATGGPYSGLEGTALSFDGSGSSDPDGDALTYAWSFGDGSSGTGVKPSHSYANNAVYTVTLTVTDARGASSAPVTTTATIANVAPTVNAGANQTGSAGSALTVSASFTDPGVNDAPWSYAFDWGDGSTQTAGSTTSQATPLTATHTYQTAGTYSVQVTVTDRDGASGVGAKSVTVSPAAATVTLVGAGTVASCSSSGDEATAAILDATPGTVFTLGDNVYPSGSLANYQNCYNPSWGRHKVRTAPALGNHEYDTSPTAADYFSYFGAAAGDPTKGYYSYDLGAWHIVALNSDVSMSAGSAQEQWLRTDLAAHPQRCSLAYWHHPRFSSGSTHGSMAQAQPLWQALYDAGAEIVLSGHEHNYERFAPQTPGGALDLARGIREFVVGTGGGSGAYPFGTPIANSEVRITGVNGVLKLTLGDGSYSWQFIPVAGQTATDSGSGTCH